jgi:hypothetical protein
MSPVPADALSLFTSYCTVLLLFPFTVLIRALDIPDFIERLSLVLSSNSLGPIYHNNQEAMASVIFAMQVIFSSLRNLQSQFYGNWPFTFRLLSSRIGAAWNGFLTPCSLQPLQGPPEPWPPFEEFLPFRFRRDGPDDDPLEVDRTLRELIAILAPFAALLPSTVLHVWLRFVPGDDLEAAPGPIADAIDHLRLTIHAVAVDGRISELRLIRLDGLLRLHQYKREILWSPKVRIDFVAIPVIPHERKELAPGTGDARQS